MVINVYITVWRTPCLERKEKREKLAAEGLEPRVSSFSHHNRCATDNHRKQPLYGYSQTTSVQVPQLLFFFSFLLSLQGGYPPYDNTHQLHTYLHLNTDW